jgi:chromosome segregation ATPase
LGREPESGARSQGRAHSRAAEGTGERPRRGAGYEAKIAELEEENRAKTKWAEGLDSELAGKMRELAQCIEYLHQAEKTVEERTRWAQGLQAEVERLRGQLALLEASRWVRLGRSVGLGPELELK